MLSQASSIVFIIENENFSSADTQILHSACSISLLYGAYASTVCVVEIFFPHMLCDIMKKLTADNPIPDEKSVYLCLTFQTDSPISEKC